MGKGIIKFLGVALISHLCLACNGPSYEEGVRSRLGRCLGVSELPPALKVGASTIDWDSGWACYQIEFDLPEKDFQNLIAAHSYKHAKFDLPRPPNFQQIEFDPPFQAVGAYERRIDGKESCKIFHEASPGRYFMLYIYDDPGD